MTIQEILDYIVKTPENANVNVLSGMLDELTSGGGSSSDFSIAHVTMTNTARHPFLINGPCLADDGMYLGIPSEFIDGSSIDIAMYKGQAYLVFASEYSDYDFALTGDITKDGTDIYVTGDGTITITDSK